MQEVIELIEKKILEINNLPITTQEEEQFHILEVSCLRSLLELAKKLS